MLAILHAQMAEAPIAASSTMPTKEYQEARETSRKLYATAIELFKALYALRSQDHSECGDHDIEALAMYARVLETAPNATQETFTQAQNLYLRMKQVLEEAKKPIPVEIHNNIGVLYYIKKDYENSKKHFLLGLSSLKGKDSVQQPTRDSSKITVMYNLARALEENVEITEAEGFHNAILREMPNYIDSKMRLGMIAFERGLLKEAHDLFDSVTKAAPMNVEAHVLLGMLNLSRQQVRDARKIFEKVVLNIDKFDIVSLLHLGNINLHSLPQSQESRRIHLLEACRIYEKVLELDPRNPHAANGIAIALRYKGLWEPALREAGIWDLALKAFEQIREADDSSPYFAVNYAHMLTELKQYKRAIPMYEKALAKFHNGKEIDLLNSISKAYYRIGKDNKQSDMLRMSIKFLQRALHIFPKDKTLFYNLAVVMQEHTYVVSTERMDKITVAKMQEAIALGQKAIDIFTWLSREENAMYDCYMAHQRATFTKSSKEKLEKRLDELISTHADRQKRLDELIRSRDEERQKRFRSRNAGDNADRRTEGAREAERRSEEFKERINSKLQVWSRAQTLISQPRQAKTGFLVDVVDGSDDESSDGGPIAKRSQGGPVSSTQKSRKRGRIPKPKSKNTDSETETESRRSSSKALRGVGGKFPKTPEFIVSESEDEDGVYADSSAPRNHSEYGGGNPHARKGNLQRQSVMGNINSDEDSREHSVFSEQSESDG